MIKHCIECGTKLKKGHKFCQNCGSNIPSELPEKIKHCPDCGNKIQESHKFCDNCGFNIPEKIEQKEEIDENSEVDDEESSILNEEKDNKTDTWKEKDVPKTKSKSMKFWLIGIILIAICIIAVASVVLNNEPPIASVTATPTSGTAPLKVSFIGSGTDKDGSISKYYWTFGDGESSNTKNPSHTYQTSGTYTARLTVTDNEGSTDSITKKIYVQNSIPTAYASATPTSGPFPLSVKFSGSGSDSDGYIDSYYWTFGDGSSSYSQNPTHAYSSSGTYTATLKVTDNEGGSNSDSIIIEVSSEPDDDGDGIPDYSDNCPDKYNPSQTDTDNDGYGDACDNDDDNDGCKDTEDYVPYQDAVLKISISRFRVIDEIDPFPALTSEGEIYFEIYVNDVKEARFPSTGSWESTIGTLYYAPSDWYIIINVPDDVQKHSINLRMYDDDTISQQLLDIDGHDDSEGLTVDYDIVAGSWTGDDTDGITDGRNDGVNEDIDCYLEYDITMI
jgi:PKD repeat protein/predicted nucleic acid-binding Zn ribbon protein